MAYHIYLHDLWQWRGIQLTEGRKRRSCIIAAEVYGMTFLENTQTSWTKQGKEVVGGILQLLLIL